jgi:hypothetical protein
LQRGIVPKRNGVEIKFYWNPIYTATFLLISLELWTSVSNKNYVLKSVINFRYKFSVHFFNFSIIFPKILRDVLRDISSLCTLTTIMIHKSKPVSLKSFFSK